MRRPILELLDGELSKRKTPLFRRKLKKKKSHGWRAKNGDQKTSYAKLHYPTFVKMARPALVKLLGNDVAKNPKRCSSILDAMLFVTRWRRANHNMAAVDGGGSCGRRTSRCDRVATLCLVACVLPDWRATGWWHVFWWPGPD